MPCGDWLDPYGDWLDPYPDDLWLFMAQKLDVEQSKSRPRFDRFLGSQKAQKLIPPFLGFFGQLEVEVPSAGGSSSVARMRFTLQFLRQRVVDF